MRTVVANRSKEAIIGDGQPTIVISEVSLGVSQDKERILQLNDFGLLPGKGHPALNMEPIPGQVGYRQSIRSTI